MLRPGLEGREQRVLGAGTAVGVLLALAVAAFGVVFSGPDSAQAAPNLNLSVSVSPASPSPGQTFTFAIRYRCASLVDHCENATIEGLVPTGLSVVSTTGQGGNVASSVQVGSTVTFSMATPGSPVLEAGATGMVTISVDTPTCGTYSEGPYAFEASFSSDGAPPASVLRQVTLSGPPPACPVPSPPPVTSLLKRWQVAQNTEETAVGTSGNITMTLPSHPNAYIATDDIPVGMLYSGELTNSAPSEIDCGDGVWHPVTAEHTSDSAFFDLIDSGAGQSWGCSAVEHRLGVFFYDIDRIRWLVPAGSSAVINQELGFPADAFAAGDQVRNCVSTDIPADTSCTSWLPLVEPGPIPLALKLLRGSPTSGGIGPTEVFPGEDPEATPPRIFGPTDLAWSLRAFNNNYSSDLVDPIITDLLPPEVEYVDYAAGGTNFWFAGAFVDNSNPMPAAISPANDPDCASPTFSQTPNFQGTGRTLLRWEFTGCTMPSGYVSTSGFLPSTFVEVYFTTTILPGQLAGEDIHNSMTLSSAAENVSASSCEDDDESAVGWPSMTVDVWDFDGDGITSEPLCSATIRTYTLPTLNDLNSAKWVQGSLDSARSRYPYFGDTALPNGTGVYELVITNSGNVPVDELRIIDLLPEPGDTAVLDASEPRLSEWSMELDGPAPLTFERWDGTVWSPIPPAEIATSYSSSTNPCRQNDPATPGDPLDDRLTLVEADANAPIGCDPNPWTASGSTADGARSFGSTWTPPPGQEFVPSEMLRVTVAVRLSGSPPAGTNEIAWNSFAFGGTWTGGDLLDSEPLKVGLRVVDTTAFSSLGDRVWLDYDQDGLQDTSASEAPLGGVTVSLYADVDADGVADSPVPLDVTTTDPSGHYRFDGRDPNATFVIALDNPSDFASGGPLFGLQPTMVDVGGDDAADSDAVLVDGWPTIVLAGTGTAGSHEDRYDFGLWPAASLGDRVWFDADGFGDQSGGEPGVEGALVTLFSADGTPTGLQTFTDASGAYLFTGLDEGSYYIVVDTSTALAPHTNSLFTLQGATGDDANDSDVSGDGTSKIVNLSPGEHLTDLDVGLVEPLPAPAEIGDRVWSDTNGNGVQDSGEPGVGGVLVLLLDAGGVPLATATTEPDGSYLFANLGPGDYGIEFVAPGGYEFTAAGVGGDDAVDSDADPTTGQTGTLSVAAGDSDLGRDAGLLANLSLGNRVWHDVDDNGILDAGEAGLVGVAVNLLDGAGSPILDGGTPVSTTTDLNGRYLFPGLAAGDYRVEVVLDAGVRSTRDTASSSTPSNGVDLDDNGVDLATPGVVRSGVVSLSLGSAPTGEGDHGTAIGGVLDPRGDDMADYSVDFGLNFAVAVGNQVWRDLDDDGVFDSGETGIGGVTVTAHLDDGDGVYGPGDTARASTLTDSVGEYFLGDLAEGSYFIVIPAGDFGPAGPLAGLASSNGAGNPNATAAADDLVDDGTTIGAEVVSNGPVTLVASAAPLGEVSVGDPGFADESANWMVDFGFAPAAGQLGDQVWFDGVFAPGAGPPDGLYDGTEAPVVGATVTILDTVTGLPVAVGASGAGYVASQSTGADGSYLFTDLAPGSYAIEVDVPGGVTFTTQDAGADDSLDSDVDPSGSSIGSPVVVGAGELVDDLDAGVAVRAEIGLEKQVLLAGGDPADEAAWIDADTAPGAYFAVGEVARFRFRVTNEAPPGGASLTDVVLDDPTVGVTGCPASLTVDLAPVGGVLDPGEAVLVEPAACLSAPLDGSFVNTATATGVPSTATGETIEALLGLPAGTVATVVSTDPAQTTTIEPILALDKSPDTQTIAASAPSVAFTLAVQNLSIGVDELRSVVVSDPLCDSAPTLDSGDADADGQLDRSETWLYSCIRSRPVDGWPSTWTNTATVDAQVPPTDPDGNPFPSVPVPAADDSTDLFTSEVSLTKRVREQDAAAPDGGGGGSGPWSASETILRGEAVDWQVVFLNPSAIPFDAVEFADDLCPALNGPAVGLGGMLDVAAGSGISGDLSGDGLATASPGESWTFTCSSVSVDADAVNTVAVVATAGGAPATQASASASVVVVEPHVSTLLEVLHPTLGWIDADSVASSEGANEGEHGVFAADQSIELRLTVFNPDAAGDGSAAPNLTGLSVEIVTPDGLSDVLTLPDLAAGASLVWTSADDPALAIATPTVGGSIVATVSATGSFLGAESFGPVLADDGVADGNDSDEVALLRAAIGLVKRAATTGGVAVDANDDEPPLPVPPNTAVVFELTVSNEGETPLGDIVVDDAMADCALGSPVGDVGADAILSVGESWILTCVVADGFASGTHRNVGTVSAVPGTPGSPGTPAGPAVSAMDPATVDVVPNAMIGNVVWHDLDADGVQDSGEPGVAGVLVELIDATGAVVASATTLADGLYLFEVPPGPQYGVSFTPPAGYQLSPVGLGPPSGLDSDADPVCNCTEPIDLSPGEIDLTWDAGLWMPASIGDRVWLDADGNGVQDAGEAGVPGVVVRLLDSGGSELSSVTTNPSGGYAFTDLGPGTYAVEFVAPAGFPFTGATMGADPAADSDAAPTSGRSDTVVISSGFDETTIDAGLVAVPPTTTSAPPATTTTVLATTTTSAPPATTVPPPTTTTTVLATTTTSAPPATTVPPPTTTTTVLATTTTSAPPATTVPPPTSTSSSVVAPTTTSVPPTTSPGSPTTSVPSTTSVPPPTTTTTVLATTTSAPLATTPPPSTTTSVVASTATSVPPTTSAGSPTSTPSASTTSTPSASTTSTPSASTTSTPSASTTSTPSASTTVTTSPPIAMTTPPGTSPSTPVPASTTTTARSTTGLVTTTTPALTTTAAPTPDPGEPTTGTGPSTEPSSPPVSDDGTVPSGPSTILDASDLVATSTTLARGPIPFTGAPSRGLVILALGCLSIGVAWTLGARRPQVER